MYYKPHKLYRKFETITRDKYGRPIASPNEWEFLCNCRCDDSDIETITTDQGHVHRVKHHIVCEGHVEPKVGDEIKVLTKGEEIRGEGIIVSVKRLNALGYTEVWV